MAPRLHAYGLDSRLHLVPYLVVAGMIVAAGWGVLQSYLPFSIPAVIDTPATLGFYGMLFWLLDRWGWRVRPLSTWMDVPVLEGEYDVAIRSSNDDLKAVHAGTATIRQSWTQLCVHLRMSASESWSEAAHVTAVAADGGFQLGYQYRNQPTAGAPAEWQAHEGTAWLRLSADGSRLVGEYYTSGRARRTFGTIELTRRR